MSTTTTETHVATVRVPMVSRNYRVTASSAGLHFYRDFDDEPGTWHLEGDAPGIEAADWEAALRRHITGG